MPGGIYVAYSGAAAQQAELEIIANNIANAATAGFRRDRTSFDTVLAAQLPYAGVSRGSIDFTPGTLQLTQNPLNVAIEGEGFFTVEGEGGEVLYTRRGDFRLNAAGELVLPNGRAVLGQGGPITVPVGLAVQIRADGQVETEEGPAGRLKVVQFADPASLEKVGASLIRALPTAEPQPVDQVRLAVGFVEQSNVSLPAEIANLTYTARAFEAAMKSLKIQDELTKSVVELNR